jgi:hypothetical protein
VRNTAKAAGMVSHDSEFNRCELVLEPDAACIFCIESGMSAFVSGQVFMVLDCGGGTVDTTLHRVRELQPNLSLEEMEPPSGGVWGSKMVDRNFKSFIKDFLGEATMQNLETRNGELFNHIMKSWEEQKKQYRPDRDRTRTIDFGPFVQVVYAFLRSESLIAITSNSLG